MTCPNESVGLKPSKVFDASQLDRNPWEHHRQCLCSMCFLHYQLTNSLPKSPPQHISSPEEETEGELLNVYVLEGEGEVPTYGTEDGRSWGRCLRVSVPSSVAATAAAVSGPSHMKALTSPAFG